MDAKREPDANTLKFTQTSAWSKWKDLHSSWVDKYASPYKHGRLVERNGRQLWVVVIDRKDPETVFLFHGGGGRAEQWSGVIQYLLANTSYNIIVPDFLGHGRSSKPAHKHAYAWDEMVADALFLVRTFGTDTNHLVGHSVGSAIAMELVSSDLQHDKFVGKVVLAGTAHQAPPQTKTPFLKCCYCFLECIRPLVSAKSAASLYHPEFIRNNTDLVNIERQVNSQNPFFVISPLCVQLDWPDEQQQKSINKDTLIIQGAADVITPLDSAKKVSEAIPNSTLRVLDDAAHNLMMEKPDVVGAHIVEFISGKQQQQQEQ